MIPQYMKLKYFFLAGAILMAAMYVYWMVGQWLWLDLSPEELKLYGIRRELPLIEALLLYVAWRMTP